MESEKNYLLPYQRGRVLKWEAGNEQANWSRKVAGAVRIKLIRSPNNKLLIESSAYEQLLCTSFRVVVRCNKSSP